MACASASSAAKNGRSQTSHNWARRGVLVAHIGFVIIAAGTTWYWARGFSGEMPILTGATATIPQTGAQIKLDHFDYRYRSDSTKAGLVYQPIDYVSQVQYVGKDGVARCRRFASIIRSTSTGRFTIRPPTDSASVRSHEGRPRHRRTAERPIKGRRLHSRSAATARSSTINSSGRSTEDRDVRPQIRDPNNPGSRRANDRGRHCRWRPV